MSAVTRRPRVRAVRSAPMSESAPHTQVTSLPRSRREQLAAERRVIASSRASAGGPLEVRIAAARAGIAAAAFAVPSDALEQWLQPLAAAATEPEFEQARVELQRRVEGAHLAALSDSVAAACRRASDAAGFHDIDVRPHRFAAGIRVVATDALGRALVSEVVVNGDDVGVDTEVIGVADGTCGGILDAFDRALEGEGVTGESTRAYKEAGTCARESATSSAPTSSATRRSSSTAGRSTTSLLTMKEKSGRRSR